MGRGQWRRAARDWSVAQRGRARAARSASAGALGTATGASVASIASVASVSSDFSDSVSSGSSATAWITPDPTPDPGRASRGLARGYALGLCPEREDLHMVPYGQCPHPRGKQVGWQDRRPQAGRRRHSQADFLVPVPVWASLSSPMPQSC
ncbi:uncharacterized protein AAES06_006927 [Glossophaga mutica]